MTTLAAFERLGREALRENAELRRRLAEAMAMARGFRALTGDPAGHA
jgi:hypothetical protein